MSTPCRIGFKAARRFSVDAFSLPGRLTIREDLRIPAAERERHPFGVIFMLSARMSSGMPGVSRSMTAFVASGVISRGENPVPPVVNISEA